VWGSCAGRGEFSHFEETEQKLRHEALSVPRLKPQRKLRIWWDLGFSERFNVAGEFSNISFRFLLGTLISMAKRE
jgi:hypothetical protein